MTIFRLNLFLCMCACTSVPERERIRLFVHACARVLDDCDCMNVYKHFMICVIMQYNKRIFLATVGA